MRLGFAAIVIIGIGLVAAAPRARAQEDDAARAHFEAGRLHFDRGAYEAAQQEFEAAYELSGRPALLYNLYLTAERLGDFDTAIAHLERFLAEGSPSDEQRAQLEPRLDNLRTRRDRARAGMEPEPEPDPATPPPAPARREGDLVPALVAFGVAGAALVSFAITGGLALAEDDSLSSGCGATDRCTDDEVSTLSALVVAADVSWITAAVAATAGVVLLVTLGLPSGDSERVSLAPFFTPDGSGGVVVMGRL
ncbi:tetratricopeptide repeat protein [Sandaracinus amylolyticus]|uniref:Uncharacterized protein n=1 Tax=Sandaracinus amylolyticus TaxID=927083 RepID=A0A0F6SDN5_9BACT|nr:hypothetical protein [Sandaracinus amylolyticus]AKF03754.1 hypothetical protein DB32_000903 [Sandaracinus amylolyticus]